MRKCILLVMAVLLAAIAAGCSGQAAALQQGADAMPTSARRARRVVESTPVPPQVIAPTPTFSFRPIEIEEVATPVPVFQDRVDSEEIAEPVVPDEADQHPSQEPSPDAVSSAESIYAGNTLTIRYFDLAAGEIAEIQYSVPDSLSPNMTLALIADVLSEALDMQGVILNATSYADGNITIDFDPSIYSLGLASGDENELLQSIADTYLLNLGEIQAVYYTVGGDPYRSEHIQLEGNEAFKVRLG